MAKDYVTAKLIASLKDMIGQGSLIPGCKLPAERQLAQRFGVSRSSLRQALKVLEIMGVLTQRVGDGTYLSSNSSAILAEPLEFLVLLDGISHFELFEARFILEPEMAARAAERATSDDLAPLRRTIDAMKKGVKYQGQMVEEDMTFHDCIFRAAGNRVLQRMFHAVLRDVLTSISQTSQLANLIELQEAVAFHEAIYSAIYRREPREAHQKMFEHLEHTRGLLLKAGNSTREELSNRITTAKRQVGRR